MKKSIIAFGVVVVLIGGLLIIQNVNLNRVGADEYYTQITDEGNKTEEKGVSGQIHEQYEYELPAYDENGNQKIFTFTANKQLRENAYLMLFVKEDKGVTSYQEVSIEKIPKKSIEMLEKQF